MDQPEKIVVLPDELEQDPSYKSLVALWLVHTPLRIKELQKAID
jgi:hypothetical protein